MNHFLLVTSRRRFLLIEFLFFCLETFLLNAELFLLSSLLPLYNRDHFDWDGLWLDGLWNRSLYFFILFYLPKPHLHYLSKVHRPSASPFIFPQFQYLHLLLIKIHQSFFRVLPVDLVVSANLFNGRRPDVIELIASNLHRFLLVRLSFFRFNQHFIHLIVARPFREKLNSFKFWRKLIMEFRIEGLEELGL